MQGSDDRSTPSLFNIFVKEFLARLGERNEPSSAAEADVAGPWNIEELRYTCYGLYRRGESSARGHRPAAICKERAARRRGPPRHRPGSSLPSSEGLHLGGLRPR